MIGVTIKIILSIETVCTFYKRFHIAQEIIRILLRQRMTELTYKLHEAFFQI